MGVKWWPQLDRCSQIWLYAKYKFANSQGASPYPHKALVEFFFFSFSCDTWWVSWGKFEKKKRQDVLKKQNTYPPPLFAEENVYLVMGPPETHFCLCFTKVKTSKHQAIFLGYLLEPDVEYGLYNVFRKCRIFL
jgi:hypothetical protein